MITGRDILYTREQRRDALTLAEQHRLARQAMGRRIQAPGFVVSARLRLWLAQLGAQLISWGEYLRSRYAQPSMSA
jgi:hypothetical protein